MFLVFFYWATLIDFDLQFKVYNVFVWFIYYGSFVFLFGCMCNLFPKVVTLFFYSNKSVRTRA